MPDTDTIEIKVTAECVMAGKSAACDISAAIPREATTDDILATAPEILRAILSAGVDPDDLIVTGISSRTPSAVPYRIVLATDQGRVVLVTTISDGRAQALLEAFWRTASAQANPVTEPDAFCDRLSKMKLISIHAERPPETTPQPAAALLAENFAVLCEVMRKVDSRLGDLSETVAEITGGKSASGADRPRPRQVSGAAE